MNKRFATELARWQKVPQDKYQAAEVYLKAWEKFCVGACARFLQANKASKQSLASQSKRDHVWYIADPEGGVSSLLIHSYHSLFPVFGENSAIPGPGFLKRFLIKAPIHLVQGLREDVETLEILMEDLGYFAKERIDYELMSLDTAHGAGALGAGPAGLVLRSPLPGDKERLFALHSAYEKEEVLPQKAVFNPVSCRYNLERILSSEKVLVAELDGQLVGKLNTNAESFTRYQIGGVYVRPDCRGLGIAAKMVAVFSADLLTLGKGITLFSKMHNKAAKKVYLKAGFAVLADYRISYF